MDPEQAPIEPDTKDWTWVLGRGCPECGLDVAAVPREEVAGRLRDNADAWPPVLERGDARERPDPTTWSALEYGCHVRDVFVLFGERLTLMLDEDDPLFANWDQDETAVASRYAEQDPAAVAAETVAAGRALAARFEQLDEAAWAPDRPAQRRRVVHRRELRAVPAPRPRPPPARRRRGRGRHRRRPAVSAYDLPLEELRAHRPPLRLPEGFDGFWDRTLAELAAHPADVRRRAHPAGLTTVEVDDVRFAGWGGQDVAAWLLRPAGASGPLPCVVEFIGYGGGRGLPHERLLWSSAGLAHLVVDTRGQGSVWSSGVTADSGFDGAPTAPGVMTRGLHDPHEHYYRRLYADAARAVEVARALPEVDPGRVVAAGISQGGGVALAVAGLVPGLAGVMADVPFLCGIRRALDLTDSDPYAEVVRWCAVHRDHVEQALLTLDHVDAVHLAVRATAPALLSVALRDPVCPPSTVFSAFNHYGTRPAGGPGAGSDRRAGRQGDPGLVGQRARGRRGAPAARAAGLAVAGRRPRLRSLAP